MLLLDRNSAPTRTVYYISAICYRAIRESGSIAPVDLFDILKSSREEYRNLGYDFFVLALDFLFILNRVIIDDEGRVCAN